MTDDSIDLGLQGVRAAAERLADDLGLAPIAVPGPLIRLDGVVREVPVVMCTRRLAGRAFASFTLATIAEVAGPLRAVTVIGMPPEGSTAPILGVDLVALGGALSLVAVDLAPTDPERWMAAAGPVLGQLHLDTEGALVHRRWPEFAAEVFSRRALLAGARRGQESAALAAVARFIASLAPVYAEADTGVEPGRREAAGVRAAQWRLAERRNRREHDALTRIFGGAPAAALVDLLFPA